MAAHHGTQLYLPCANRTGYSGYERGKGWLHKRVSFDNLFTSMRYLGYALAGKPYMGIGRNMAYRKELFYAQKGFSAHLNLQRGDDDLFINKTATAENTRIETDANAVVRVQPVYRAKDWREEKISYMGTAHFYRGIQRYLSGFETTTRLLFHAAWITALVIGILNFHWLAAGIAFLLFALRYTLQALIINKTAKDSERNDVTSLRFRYLIFYSPCNHSAGSCIAYSERKVVS